VIIRLFQDVIHAGIGVFGLSVFALLAPPGRQIENINGDHSPDDH
jgi:hypothetical protein